VEHRRRTKRFAVDDAGIAGGPSGASALRRHPPGGYGSKLSNRRSLSGCPQHSGGDSGRDGQADDSQQAEPILRATELSGPLDSDGRRGTKGSGGGEFDKHAKQILDSLSAGVILLDRSLLIVGLNPAAENILGISENRAKGEPLLRLIGEDPELQSILSRVISTGNHYANELQLAPTEVHAHERVVDCRVSPLDLDLAALLVEMTDVTRRTQISRENALLIQHGAGRQMIRQLAHEIKNPLGGIRGAAQLLERQLNEDELKEYTDVVISETDRLAGLVDTLLGPGGPPDKRPVNVHELLEYVVRIIDPEGPPSLRIHRDYDPGLPDIDLDSDQMVQALLNLVQNATVALDGQGTLTLRSRAVTNFTIGTVRHRVIASIEIEDDGPGIPPELQDSVFYPLVTSRPEGTGLGLPAAQELISRHGGLIEFESRPGRTVFFVRIPLDQADSA
jgi:two-component system nitrogen regulation sensor histidine kinase GlnL